MTRPPSALTISIPFGNTDEAATSTRYHWASDQRGSDSFVIIQRTRSGTGAFRWQGRVWEVPAGHAFVCFVPEPSAYFFPDEAKEPWRFSWLNFYGPLAASLCQALRGEHGPVLPMPERSTVTAEFHKLARQAEERAVLDPCDATIGAVTFLMEWKRLLDHPLPRLRDPVETVVRICRARFREPLGIKELAAHTGLSREHLTRTFTERMGISPARHLRDLRVAAAREMLDDAGSTLKETALRCGFPSAKSLQHALRAAKANDMSPDA